MSYKFYSENKEYKRNLTRDEVKMYEAEYTGLRLDYQVTYPDGAIKECKFIKK